MAPLMSTAACLVTVLATATALRFLTQPKEAHRLKSLPSPRTTLLPQLTNEQVAALPYPPNMLPGARDVDTPYGSMRVYEWGLEGGKKVIMIPGDTTPAPIFAKVAEALVARGLRVMIIDTWGRGYSDAPTAASYDAGLFVMQVFFALASSPLAWTGKPSGGFSMIGFSLGGSVTMSFVAKFPYLVNSVVLLAPGGLIRVLPDGYESIFFRCREWVPSSYLRRCVAAVIGVNLGGSRAWRAVQSAPVTTENVSLPALWQWQFDEHQGFVHAFIETSQDGPLRDQHEDWRQALGIIGGYNAGSNADGPALGLSKSRMLVIFGDEDAVVVAHEFHDELRRIMKNPEPVVFRTVPGGHGFPIQSGEETAKHIIDFWEL